VIAEVSEIRPASALPCCILSGLCDVFRDQPTLSSSNPQSHLFEGTSAARHIAGRMVAVGNRTCPQRRTAHESMVMAAPDESFAPQAPVSTAGIRDPGWGPLLPQPAPPLFEEDSLGAKGQRPNGLRSGPCVASVARGSVGSPRL